MCDHPDQLIVTVATVRGLVVDQFPQWRDLPVRALSTSGTVNALFQLGDRLTARFPLRSAEAEATELELEAEAEAARELLGRTPFATPGRSRSAGQGRGYPLPWSVQTWLPGTTAAEQDPGNSVPFARDLASFIQGAVIAPGPSPERSRW